MPFFVTFVLFVVRQHFPLLMTKSLLLAFLLVAFLSSWLVLFVFFRDQGALSSWGQALVSV